MVSEKTCFSMRVYEIASQYGVSQGMTHSVISTYIRFCREMLMQGEPLDFLGIVYIEPDVITSKYRSTLAYRCRAISDGLSLPAHTVYAIIRGYLDSLREEVLRGIPVEIRGLVTVTPLYRDGVLGIIHSSISDVIRDKLQEGDYPVSSVRVHTHKILKDQLRRQNA